MCEHDNSKGGEGSVSNKGGWIRCARREGGGSNDGNGEREDNDGDGKVRNGGDKECGKAGDTSCFWLMFKHSNSNSAKVSRIASS